jgi:sigma-B regulation protein RsbU (phosphoserine phosphatase)
VTASETAFELFLRALREDDPQRLYDLAPCGYLSTTPDGLIVKVNRTLLTMCGFDADELVGRRRFDELLTPGGRIYHETHFAPMLRMQGAAREIAFDLQGADGTRRPVLVNAVVETDADGEPAVIRIAVFDAAQRRAYERELLEAKRRAEDSDARARALSATLQQTLMPPAPPAIDGLEVAAQYLAGEASLDIGGDFYDVFAVGDEWVLVVGDVCGRGAEAAVVTALARFTVRAQAMQHGGAAAVLRIVNDVLLGYHVNRFCTVALVRLTRRGDGGWHGSVSCGGHPLPLVRRREATIETVGRPGTVLGVVAEPALHDAPVTLDVGDALVLFTDGVLEARSDGEFFDQRRAEQALVETVGDAAALTAGLVGAVLAFQDAPRRDDIAVLTAAATG